MNFHEMNIEVLECARYGEEEDLLALLNAGADVNYVDDSGNTALHRAAANGEVGCLKILKSFNAIYKENGSGNSPIHWAAQNAKVEALNFLIENYEVDVLAQNKAGRSALTEAFDSKNTEAIEICLGHSSASEERLIDLSNKQGGSVIIEEDKPNHSETEAKTNSNEVDFTHSVMHVMCFGSEDRKLKIRELPITHADSPFASEDSPEDDTTGDTPIITFTRSYSSM
jgi:ankyrin repeat protein